LSCDYVLKFDWYCQLSGSRSNSLNSRKLPGHFSYGLGTMLGLFNYSVLSQYRLTGAIYRRSSATTIVLCQTHMIPTGLSRGTKSLCWHDKSWWVYKEHMNSIKSIVHRILPHWHCQHKGF